MASGERFLHLLIMCFAFKIASGGGTVSMRLIHFENPQSKLDDGSCCDKVEEIAGKCSPCQCYFIFCLSEQHAQNCSIQRIWTEVLAQTEYYVFDSNLRIHPSPQIAKNPMHFPVDNWNGSLSLKVDVFDMDVLNGTRSHRHNDQVTKMQRNFSLKTTRYGAKKNLKMVLLLGKEKAPGIYPKLTFEISAWCNEGYFAPTCTDYCIDTDNITGHYKCDFIRGIRECLYGWYGAKCRTQCIARNDSMGHYNCHPKTGEKICLSGWFDVSSNCSQGNTRRSVSSSVLRRYLTTQLTKSPTSVKEMSIMQTSVGTEIHPTVILSSWTLPHLTSSKQTLKKAVLITTAYVHVSHLSTESLRQPPNSMTVNFQSVDTSGTTNIESTTLHNSMTKMLKKSTLLDGSSSIRVFASKIQSGPSLAISTNCSQTLKQKQTQNWSKRSSLTWIHEASVSPGAGSTKSQKHKDIEKNKRIWITHQSYIISASGFLVFLIAVIFFWKKKRRNRIHNFERRTYDARQELCRRALERDMPAESAPSLNNERSNISRTSNHITAKTVEGPCHDALTCSDTIYYEIPSPTYSTQFLRTPEISRQSHDPIDYRRSCRASPNVEPKLRSYLSTQQTSRNSSFIRDSPQGWVVLAQRSTFESWTPVSQRTPTPRALATEFLSQSRNFLTTDDAFLSRSSVTLPQTPISCRFDNN